MEARRRGRLLSPGPCVAGRGEWLDGLAALVQGGFGGCAAIGDAPVDIDGEDGAPCCTVGGEGMEACAGSEMEKKRKIGA